MTSKQKRWITIGICTYILVLILLYVFTPTSLFQHPLITPSEYLLTKPYITLNNLIIIVPSSTIIVYLLGIYIFYIGVILIKRDQITWGSSLLFWAIGTILAGTSYQGLGYELKCTKDYCDFTSWFELAYLFTTAISISLMGFAFAKLFLKNNHNKYLKLYSEFALIFYTILLLLGTMLENRILLSYELFTVFFMPLFIVFFIFNIIQYRLNNEQVDKRFIILWILFLIVNLSYYAYYIPGFTHTLYSKTGIWFSANDVLHVGLILWFMYFHYNVTPVLKNKSSLK